MKTRSVFRIEITPMATKQLLGLSESTGVTQIAMASNLVTWFAAQPTAVQHAILEDGASGNADVTKLVLKRMAKRD